MKRPQGIHPALTRQGSLSHSITFPATAQQQARLFADWSFDSNDSCHPAGETPYSAASYSFPAYDPKLFPTMNKMSQINRRHTITASEVGDFAYCQKAWYLKRCGEVAESPHLEAGTAFHATHEAGVSQAARLNRAGKRLGVIAFVLLVVIAFIWVVTEMSR